MAGECDVLLARNELKVEELMSLSFRNLLDAEQINTTDIDNLFELAETYRQTEPKETLRAGPCYGSILASLFFEPSTRTRFSFEAAMLKLGGQVVNLEDALSSSVKKGETLSDMGKIMSGYTDIIVMRHPEVGSVHEFSRNASVPVINAGDGSNQHPTQSLLDLYTIYCEKKRLDSLNIGFVGDLKHSRTVHSLLTLVSLYSNNKITLISHPNLTLDAAKKERFEKGGLHFETTSDLEEGINKLDVLYVTRIQRERFESEQEYRSVKDLYQIGEKVLSYANPEMIIMHPLPRVNEILPEVDASPNARYFMQANYGLFMRMALLSSLNDLN